jgi:hypothetical protein
MTAGVLAARLAAAPALSDPLGSPMPPGLHLATPWLYALFGPLFSLWDGVSMLSMVRLRGFLVGLLLGYLLWRGARALWWQVAWSDAPPPRSRLGRELRLLGGAVLVLLLFVVVGLLWHRPMLALAGVDPDDAAVDFHSHTNVSHDVRHTLMRGYDSEANLRWHRRAGFDAVFITDHNTTEGLRPHAGPPVRCPGIEVSAWNAHIVLLGDSFPVDQRRYSTSMDGLLMLLRSSDSAYGALSLASLPEYQQHLWNALERLVGAGLDGFEIVNAAPKANEITQAQRDSVIALARRTNRFVVGVSDNHGWGATSMVWNLVRAPGWRESPAALCPGILGELRRGFPAVRIIERHHLRVDSGWPPWLTPAGVLWETWRGMSWPVTVSWLIWIWIGWVIRRWRRA